MKKHGEPHDGVKTGFMHFTGFTGDWSAVLLFSQCILEGVGECPVFCGSDTANAERILSLREIDFYCWYRSIPSFSGLDTVGQSFQQSILPILGTCPVFSYFQAPPAFSGWP